MSLNRTLTEAVTQSVTNPDNLNLYAVIALDAGGIALATEQNHPVVSAIAGTIGALAAGVVVAEGFLRDRNLPFMRHPHEPCLDVVRHQTSGGW